MNADCVVIDKFALNDMFAAAEAAIFSVCTLMELTDLTAGDPL